MDREVKGSSKSLRSAGRSVSESGFLGDGSVRVLTIVGIYKLVIAQAIPAICLLSARRSHPRNGKSLDETLIGQGGGFVREARQNGAGLGLSRGEVDEHSNTRSRANYGGGVNCPHGLHQPGD